MQFFSHFIVFQMNSQTKRQMMQIIDTHSHLYEVEFDEDREDAIKRLAEKHVSQVFLPNIDSESIDRMFQLYHAHPSLFQIMMGLHPTSVKENYKVELENIRNRFKGEEICGIGEIGIDLYWDKEFLAEQTDAFDTQVAWAIEMGLPIIIHTRKAFEETFKSLKKFDKSKLRGIFHCYSGSKEIAQEIFKAGDFYLGIGGVVTFKNAGLAEVVAEIPLERLVLETDCPYLTPAPYRGQRNESSYVYYVAEKIAAIKQISIEEVAAATTQNAGNIFDTKISL